MAKEEVDEVNKTSPSTILAPLLLVILVPLILVSVVIFLTDASPYSSSNSSLSSFSSLDVRATVGRRRPWLGSTFSNIDHSSGVKKKKKNEGGSHGSVPAPEKELSKLEKLEAGLSMARAAIRKAATSDNHNSPLLDEDYVPHGSIYHNPHLFHRSYLEMEKIFKVFVYTEGEPPMFHDGPCKGVYSTEGRFIHDMDAGNPFRTMDPDEAHMYFLPISITNLVVFLYEYNHDMSNIKRTTKDFVDTIASKYPYWNRSLGADHFYLSCHDWGPHAARYSPILFNNSVRVLCNANTSEGFNPAKDASLPEIRTWASSEINKYTFQTPPIHRPLLGFFAGQMHGPVRPILLEHWKNKDKELQVFEVLPKNMSYQEMMLKSKYCLCPSGFEVASPRIDEAVNAECVPVILSNNFVLPLSDVLNWRSFSVIVPVDDIPKLKSILMGIPEDEYWRLRMGLKQVKRHYTLNAPPKRYDAFHMILHSIWLRRLNIHVTDQHSHNTTNT